MSWQPSPVRSEIENTHGKGMRGLLKDTTKTVSAIPYAGTDPSLPQNPQAAMACSTIGLSNLQGIRLKGVLILQVEVIKKRA